MDIEKKSFCSTNPEQGMVDRGPGGQQNGKSINRRKPQIENRETFFRKRNCEYCCTLRECQVVRAT